MPHDALKDLPHGWFHHGDQMLALLETHRPQTIVELGTWQGASAIAMARVARAWGGVVYCVDTWMGNVNGGVAPGRAEMLTECAWNCQQAGVIGSIRFLPMLTLEAARWWTLPIDCLYVDADHTFDAVLADLEAWTPHLKNGGLLCGDDYLNPMYPGVRAAWDHFQRTHRQTFDHVVTPNTDPPGMAFVYGIYRPAMAVAI